MQLHSSSGKWRVGLALTLTTCFLWGILPLALSVTLNVLDVYTITGFRFIAAFLTLGIYLAWKRQLPSWKKLQQVSWKLWGIATLFLAGNYLLFVSGLAKTSATTAEVLIQIAPVFMGLGAIIIFKERYSRLQWCGLGILTLGFILFFNEKLQVLIVSPTQYLLGSFLIFFAAICWAIYALTQKQLLLQLPSSNIMLGIYGGSTLLFAPISSPQTLLNLNLLEFAILLFCGLNTLLAYGAFAEALEHWEASRVSAVLAITPIVTLVCVEVFSSIFPAFVTPEHHTPVAILGAFLVVVGSATIALGQTQKLL
ncbi:DMT family transporter [Limnoraphis robusta]|uniref:Membrane protein n=1 Tax=Limnoraphis robusta CS-951 TaxID=1637645 RepID=A0A0F5YD49_9CYAN|nr:DMT family transporter [Limnoraphis robusta]KKD36663.1 membrane protein [Limnoraphis robusta CS-951]